MWKSLIIIIITLMTRPYNNQQKIIDLKYCGLCCLGWPQNKTERIWKEG